MSFENIFLISGSLFCLAAAFVTFGIFSRRKPESSLPVLAIYILTLAVSAVYTVIGWNDYDFISPASVWSFLAPLGAAAALAFMFYNWYPPVIELKDSGADLLGFLLGGLLIWCAAEGSGTPAVIFSMLLICETFFALAQKLTFLPRFADLRADTAYARAIASGLTPQVVASHVLRINLLLILFGCFQVYAPNQFSIPLVCAAVTAWQMYRLQNWQTLTSGLRETNRAVIGELKKNFSELKNNFNKTDKPD